MVYRKRRPSSKNPAYAVKGDDSNNERQDNILPMLNSDDGNNEKPNNILAYAVKSDDGKRKTKSKVSSLCP
jgi:hypothetical protein